MEDIVTNKLTQSDWTDTTTEALKIANERWPKNRVGARRFANFAATEQKENSRKQLLQQQQQQHFISPHNIQEIRIYNNSTDDDRGAGSPK